MSYEPSHRKPPRQERWPNATPGEGWPAYQQGDGGRARESAAREPAAREPAPWEPAAAFAGSGNGYGTTTAYPALGDGYADGFDGAIDGAADGFDGYADGFDGYASGGTENYRETRDGYDGYDGYTRPGHEFAGSADYLAQDQYSGSSVLVAPDTTGEWWRQPDQDQDADRRSGGRGPMVGAVTGLLAAAVAIGVTTFAGAFVRPPASPVSAMAGAFTDHLPASLKGPVAAHLGAHGGTVLLLGAIGIAAMVFGCAARHNASAGVAGLAAFGLLGAFVAITRPESPASDVIPWAIGGAAGILALIWLARASAPIPAGTSPRPAYGGGRRAR